MIVFSIVIPCFNEAEHIERCLSSITSQNFPRDQFEIIVVDNGSTDRSSEISRASADKVIERPGVKVGAVRNIGASEAKGENLVFIDADCTLDKDWLKRAFGLLTSQRMSVFGGGCSLPPGAKWIEKFWLLEGVDGNTLPKDLIGCSIAIPRDVFISVGGFDESMSSGEDSELSNRLKTGGYEVTLTRDLNVVHWGNAKSQLFFFQRQVWHAELYKKSFRSNLKDPVFLLAVAFGTSAVAALALILLGSKASLLPLFILIIAPSALTVKRYFRSKRRPESIQEALLAYYLDLLYLSGRAYGLLKIAAR